jgi:hypothetical protein
MIAVQQLPDAQGQYLTQKSAFRISVLFGQR